MRWKIGLTREARKKSKASGSRFTLTPSLGLIPAIIAISDIPLKLDSLGYFKQFYVVRPQSYRVRRNNANYTAITPFQVI